MELRTQTLHPTARELLDRLDGEIAPSYDVLTVEGARELSGALYAGEGEPEPVGDVQDLSIPGPDGGKLSIRVYVPDGSAPFPVLLWFHGGGFVLGGLDSHDQTCRILAAETDSVIVSVDYRLAPEHPFPAAVRDVYTAATWVENNAAAVQGDPDRLAIGGQSAGGNLAAVTALLSQNRGHPDRFDHQVLVYPVTDWSLDTDSYRENAEGYYLTRAKMAWFADLYLEYDLHAHHPFAAPLKARDLADLPPATVLTAGYDPLRDEGIAYARRLADAGVPVEHAHHPDTIHGFFVMHDDPAFPQAQQGIATVADELQKTFETIP